MKWPRPKVWTLLSVVAALAVLVEVSWLGQRSRRYAAEALRAAELARSSLQIARDAALSAAEDLKEADRVAAADPAKAAGLRLDAERLIRGVRSREAKAAEAARARAAFERAWNRPWETPRVPDDWLYATPPLDSP